MVAGETLVYDLPDYEDPDRAAVADGRSEGGSVPAADAAPGSGRPP